MKKYLIQVWCYFKNSWEGDDGKASSKKLSMLAFVITMLIYGWYVHDEITLYVFWTYAALFSILIGIMSWTQLTALIKFTLPRLRRERECKDLDDDNEEIKIDKDQQLIK